jgi:hypothetical protein
MSYLSLSISFVISLVMASCAAPQQPSSMSSSGVSPVKSQQPAAGADSGNIDYGGAAVGESSQMEDAKKCISAGTFFDRRSPATCTGSFLVQKSCLAATLGVVLNAAQKKGYDQAMAPAAMAGYVLDQCLDCTSPVGNPSCEGTGKQSAPGIRIFVARDGANGLVESKSMYFVN